MDSILSQQNASTDDENNFGNSEIEAIDSIILKLYGLERFNEVLDVPIRFFYEKLKEIKDDK